LILVNLIHGFQIEPQMWGREGYCPTFDKVA